MRANFATLKEFSDCYLNLDSKDPSKVKPEFTQKWASRIKDLESYLKSCEEEMLIPTPDDSDYGYYNMHELLDIYSSWLCVFLDLTSMITNKCREALHDWWDISANVSHMFDDYEDPFY